MPKRLTPHRLTRVARAIAAGAGVGAAIALTGPFRYADLGLPFPDTVAHALLFYGLTLLGLAALPRSRAADLALAAIAIGGASEVVQSMVGREMSLHDFLGDSSGVLAAYAPIVVAELRRLARRHPHMSFAELARMDRRRGRQRPSPIADQASA